MVALEKGAPVNRAGRKLLNLCDLLNKTIARDGITRPAKLPDSCDWHESPRLRLRGSTARDVATPYSGRVVLAYPRRMWQKSVVVGNLP